MDKQFNIDINNLTLENIGAWPTLIKAITIVLLFVAILFLGYWLDTQKQLTRLSSGQKAEADLRQEFESKAALAANLNAYQVQLAAMKKMFRQLLGQLPTQTEVPNLLEEISKAGVAVGLEFVLFAPQPEIQHEFFAELPIQIKVIGNYHKLATFLSRTAVLERIVTWHDFKIEPYKQDANKISSNTPNGLVEARRRNPDDLVMEITARTYRYAEPVAVPPTNFVGEEKKS